MDLRRRAVPQRHRLAGAGVRRLTLDRPAPGLRIAQPERGFRYGAEAFWLAGFALEGLGGGREGLAGLDLGTGSGIVAALLARAGLDMLGVDVRPEWEPLWARTLAESEVAGRLELRLGDVATGGWTGRHLVVSNPPFFPSDTGPTASDGWRAAARTEGSATLDRFMEVGLSALTSGGRLCVVVPMERAVEIRGAAGARGARVTRAVRVGRIRWLGELMFVGEDVPDEVIDESHPRARAWYELARLG